MGNEKTHEIDYPFTWESTDPENEYDARHVYDWRPGCYEIYDQDPYGRGCLVANEDGKMVLTEIKSVEMPKPYKERVLYTRTWIKPNGEAFGKKQIKVIARAGFTNLLKGYRHSYDLTDAEEK